ncbi:ATP-dependent DNA helicase DinG [Bacillus sp. SM2101]|uniref:ATP-dependent DNA helicase DinG n=1 Tax=Bacillus sp. SM2101 TaxID=2805366 RepID=UPI001BDEE32D|nr:ATP-dependent DNA helicase DinG [Bacillus sp. SM2101]
MFSRFVVIDLETTGNAVKSNDKIIQIAAVVIEDGKIIDRFSSFVNPNREIPAFISELTGITNSMVTDAPMFTEIAPIIINMLENSYFVAHNVPFDLNFLQEEIKSHGFSELTIPSLDTVELARILYPTKDSYKLSDLSADFVVEHLQPHRADSDAEVTAILFLELINKLNSLPLVTLEALKKHAVYLKSDVIGIIAHVIEHKHSLGEEVHTGLTIVRGLALRTHSYLNRSGNLQQQAFRQLKNDLPSLMEKHIINFELREGQLHMMDVVDKALQTNQHAIIEAGTGSGKTLAYLLPAALFAITKNKPVIISTYTVQLQEQLVDNEIKILRNLLDVPLKVAVLKGKRHYMNLWKFERSLAYLDSNYDVILTKCQILVWLLETTTGDVDELNLTSGGLLFWDEINEHSHTLLNNDNPWKPYEFYHKARNEAHQADVIITNHSLMLTDLQAEHSSLLPKYDVAIIDEAHQLERIASECFGDYINYNYFVFLFAKLGSLDQPSLLSNAFHLFSDKHLNVDSFRIIDHLIKNLKAEVDDLFRMLRAIILKNNNDGQAYRTQYRFNVSEEHGREWNASLELVSRVRMQMIELVSTMQTQFTAIKSIEHKLSVHDKREIDLFFSFIEKFNHTQQVLESILLVDNQESVSWMETDTKGAQNAVKLYTQPIDVSDLLADEFFSNKHSVILTSATLNAHESFKHIINQLGLEDFYPLTEFVPSPFVYEKQALLCIPNDVPLIKETSTEDYIANIANHIVAIASKLQGRMLLLFTSYDMVREMYSQLKVKTELDDFVILAQGSSSSSRSKLSKTFQEISKSILLGTSSFWEGVDLVGEELASVGIIRLPFSSPDDPISAAKNEKIRFNGGNPFTELALPDAIFRFKQGVGRLIRHKSDKGIIFVFDRRLTTTSYGKQFLAAVPTIPVIEGSIDRLLSIIEEWH